MLPAPELLISKEQITPAAEPEMSILVVSYNTCDLTLACLRSVYAETTRNRFEIIVVDNASTDGSATAIAAQFPDVTLITSTENLGFANANNLAATHARSDWIDRKSTRLNSSHTDISRMPSSA